MIGARSVLGIIPARGGSKGIPRKNLVTIEGRPLVAWTIEAALRSSYIDRLIISSDDEEIMAAAVAAGCEAPFRRPASLATDKSTSVDVALDALERLPGYDIFVMLQPTSPLRTDGDIDRAIEELVRHHADCCVSVTEAETHPYLTFGAGPRNYLEPYFALPTDQSLRRQDLPAAWALNGAVYAALSAHFIEHPGFLPEKTVPYAMPKERSLDIDTPEDLRQLLAIIGQSPPSPQP